MSNAFYTDKGVCLVEFHCDGCGAMTGIPWAFYKRWDSGVEPGKVIHCGCCGHRWTRGEGEVQRLEKRLAAERAAHDQTRAARDAKDRQLIAAKGERTKLRKRIGNGVCPCCNRTFSNLQRHMHTQHPDFDGAVDGGVSRREGVIAEAKKAKP